MGKEVRLRREGRVRNRERYREGGKGEEEEASRGTVGEWGIHE